MSKNLYMEKVGKKAKIASKNLLHLNSKKKDDVLKQFCIYLKRYKNLILKENQKDILKVKKILKLKD